MRSSICRNCENGPSEANPGSVSERKAHLLRERGVNRISPGVQSFDDGLLQLLGREHTAAQAEASFALLRRAGFKNLNIDLMFGLPGQTLAQWEATLRRALALGSRSCSAYCLTYEEDTDFFLRMRGANFRLIRKRTRNFLSARRIVRRGRVRALRSFELRPARFRIGPQPRLLEWQRLILGSDRAPSRPWGCGAGKTFRIIGSMPIVCCAVKAPSTGDEILTRK
jgi:radical SAM superfamily enzyme YgiQ (UPF0313 family)